MKSGSVTKQDFVEALAYHDITMDDHRLSYHIRMAEMSGIICSGDLHPSKATYALTADIIGIPPEKIDRDEALMHFTRTYFQSRQPATLEDFVWWSGLSVSDCKRGIMLLGDSIHTERLRVGASAGMKWQSREFYFTDNCRTLGFRKGNYLLIPPYDEYLISYKSRDIVLSPEHRHRAHNNSGIFQPIIAKDGIICSNRSPFKDDCQADFFLGEYAGNLQEEWARYRRFLLR